MRAIVRTLVTTFALALTLALGATAVAPAERPVVIPICQLALSSASVTSSSCPPRPEFLTSFVPKRLPRKEMAPIAVSVQGGVGFADGSQPPAVREFRIDFDRNTEVDASELPACGRALLETLGNREARRRCRDSIIGLGTARAAIPPLSPNAITLPLTLFNAGVRDGTTTLLIHTSIASPSKESLVVAVKIERVENGRYGWEAVARIPEVAAGEASLLDFDFVIGRSRRGAVPAWRYALARCPDDHLVARATFVLADDTQLIGTVTRSCTPRAAPAASSAG
ncbi:MAG TPA: hypothetical protein VIS51_03020 [Solirubrobacterales bacterium]